MLKRLLFVLLLAAFAGPAVAQGETITLVPFTEDQYGISGVAPAGWDDTYASGLWIRLEPTQVVLAQQGIIGNFNQIVGELLIQLGLSRLPEPDGSISTDELDWVLYSIDGPEGMNLKVDFAISTKDASVYLVLLQTNADERDALRESVFLPVVNALTPVDAQIFIPEGASYTAENVTFRNGADMLAGTLTLPEGDGPHPALVMITGSGPQDRDEAIAGTTLLPFALLADAFARSGIATLRYDDRGYGRSGGDYNSATTADFAVDAAAAFAYLYNRPEIDSEQIGVLGHSEGGVIAAHLVAEGVPVAFYVLMAAPAVDGTALLIRQNERLYPAEHANNQASQTWTDEALEAQMAFITQMFPLVLNGDRTAMQFLLNERVRTQVAGLTDEQRALIPDIEAFIQDTVASQLADFQRQWWPYYLRYDPAPAWEAVTVPVLAVYGALDVQVDAEQNATALQAALDKSPAADLYSIVTLEHSNHLFQYAITGAVSEYGILQPTFDAEFIPTITNWLLEQVTLP